MYMYIRMFNTCERKVLPKWKLNERRMEFNLFENFSVFHTIICNNVNSKVWIFGMSMYIYTLYYYICIYICIYFPHQAYNTPWHIRQSNILRNSLEEIITNFEIFPKRENVNIQHKNMLLTLYENSRIQTSN